MRAASKAPTLCPAEMRSTDRRCLSRQIQHCAHAAEFVVDAFKVCVCVLANNMLSSFYQHE